LGGYKEQSIVFLRVIEAKKMKKSIEKQIEEKLKNLKKLEYKMQEM